MKAQCKSEDPDSSLCSTKNMQLSAMQEVEPFNQKEMHLAAETDGGEQSVEGTSNGLTEAEQKKNNHCPHIFAETSSHSKNGNKLF